MRKFWLTIAIVAAGMAEMDAGEQVVRARVAVTTGNRTIGNRESRIDQQQTGQINQLNRQMDDQRSYRQMLEQGSKPLSGKFTRDRIKARGAVRVQQRKK